MTIAEAQSAFCKLIHATEDPSCVTLGAHHLHHRCAAKPDYTADDWYKRLDKEAVAEYREAYPREDWILTDVRWMLIQRPPLRFMHLLRTNRRSSSGTHRERGGEGETGCQCRAV